MKKITIIEDDADIRRVRQDKGHGSGIRGGPGPCGETAGIYHGALLQVHGGYPFRAWEDVRRRRRFYGEYRWGRRQRDCGICGQGDTDLLQPPGSGGKLFHGRVRDVMTERPADCSAGLSGFPCASIPPEI